VKAAGRFWRKASEFGKAPRDGYYKGCGSQLIRGIWGAPGRRWRSVIKIGNSQPVVEGYLTLRVAKRLKSQLEKLGADVTLLRKSDRPNTNERPEALLEAERRI